MQTHLNREFISYKQVRGNRSNERKAYVAIEDSNFYGFETVVVKKRQETEVEVLEKKILRVLCGRDMDQEREHQRESLF